MQFCTTPPAFILHSVKNDSRVKKRKSLPQTLSAAMELPITVDTFPPCRRAALPRTDAVARCLCRSTVLAAVRAAWPPPDVVPHLPRPVPAGIGTSGGSVERAKICETSALWSVHLDSGGCSLQVRPCRRTGSALPSSPSLCGSRAVVAAGSWARVTAAGSWGQGRGRMASDSRVGALASASRSSGE